MSKKNKIIIRIIVLAIILIAVGYAVIFNVDLNISGTANATAEQDNFQVEFTGNPETSGDNVTATIDSANPLSATIIVTGLTTTGDTATYTIQNKSADLSASVNTNSNEEYFEVSQVINEPTTIEAQ